MTAKTCAFWDCRRVIPYGGRLCRLHYVDYRSGEIDRCAGCGRMKEIEYELCLDCYRGGGAHAAGETGHAIVPGPGSPGMGLKAEVSAVREHRSYYSLEDSPAWDLGDATADRFYVYLLKLGDGSFYPGQTRDLQERMMEHRDGGVLTTAGNDPRLVWFAQVSSRQEAAELEAGLKELIDRNPRQVRKLVVRFRNLLSEVDTSV